MSDIRTLLIDLCQRAGLDPDRDIDVGNMHGRLDGMALSSRTDVRSVLEVLQTVFLFDVVERDGALRFVPRGVEAVLALAEDELVRKDDGSLVTVTRKQEEDLPRQVDVTYTSPANDYQSNTQSARRLHCSTQTIETVSLPLSLSDSQARVVAERLLSVAWAERETMSFRLSLAQARLDPTDVVDLTLDGSQQRLRLTGMQLGDGVVEVEAVVDDAEVLVWQADGAAAGSKVKELRSVPASVPLLLDLPLLREEDDGATCYAAVSYAGSGSWSGAALQASRDGGASWQSIADLRRAAVWGTCRTVLGDGHVPCWDNANTVEVVLQRGSLESRDRQAVLAGANMAVIGEEIVQFREAALIAPDTYRLSGLLRGRRGSEQRSAGHGPGERFVLLRSEDVVRITGYRELIGVPVLVRAVTYGLYAGDQAAMTFTNTANALKPLAPGHAKGLRDTVSGDWAIWWTRRSRQGGPWLDGADLPLGEESERYELEVLQGNAVRRTLASTTPAATYGAAQQLADFGALQDRLHIRLYQMSALIGRGIASEVTL